ncbi:MAG: hypothetical protein KAW17_01115 [Candidatus Eisenbacteria sp.]|nr:hypothetical protein [Candidatus Eisenbacteria bacterium]
MEIGSILGTGGSGQDAGQRAASGEMGREQFLELLLTQLQMQDPLDPMKNDQMIAQLAQFSSLEQLENMNYKLTQNLEVDLLLGQLLNNTMATTLIGRGVRIATDSFRKAADEPAALGYRLYGDAQSVEVSIYDSNGRRLATIDNLEHSKGDHSFEWDGRDSKGNLMPAGSYTFSVTAVTGDGGQVAVDELLVGKVDGIRYRDGTAWLVMGENESLMADVLEVVDEL